MMQRAVVFHGKDDIRIESVQIAKCGPGKVKVKPAFCGICGTDLHEYLGGPNICPTTPHPITGTSVPLTFGHEFSATVEEVGEGVSKFKPGDRVCVEPIIWDGLSGWGGGLSEHCVVPETGLYKLPDSVSMEIGALIEPLAVGWHAVKTSQLRPHEAALVLGGGPIGLSVIQALKAHGVQTIIVSEVAKKRKQFAQNFGATNIVDPTKSNLVDEVKALTGGRGVPVVFDCAGVQGALEEAIESLRVRGVLINIAIWERPASFNATKMLLKEKRYQGIATYHRGDFQEVLDAIAAGKMKPEGMITKKIAMDDVIEGGFHALIKDKANQVKVLVEVGASSAPQSEAKL